ncbi:MAG: alcohol dehydrogenase catalytic domain-containing protein [Mycobacterium sp.]
MPESRSAEQNIEVDGAVLLVRSPADVAVEKRTYTVSPAAGQVVIRPHFVGICGTDLEIVRGDLDPAYVRYPLVLGHEWSGTVLALGDGVTGLELGDPVVVEGILPCMTCTQCRKGATNLCLNYDELGFTADGAAGPAVVVPEYSTHKLRDAGLLELGALVEPAAVVLRGLLEIGLDPGRRVLVIGDGTVALLAANLVRMWSPATVVMAGLRSEQRDLAINMGVDEFSVEPPAERAFDVVIEAAGSTAAVETALRSAVRGGYILLLGISGHGKAAQLFVDDVVNNDLTIRGSFSYTAAAWAGTVRLLNAGSFRPQSLITHRFGIGSAAAALDLLAVSDGQPRGKILIDMLDLG